MALIVLSLLQIPERFLKSNIYRVVTVSVASTESEAVLAAVRALLEREGKIMDLEVTQDLELGLTTLALYIRTHQRFQGAEIVAKSARSKACDVPLGARTESPGSSRLLLIPSARAFLTFSFFFFFFFGEGMRRSFVPTVTRPRHS